MKRFTLTEEHVTLLQSMNVRWYRCEFGAPGVDCKRPYGNSGSQVLYDMAEILSVETVRVEGGRDRLREEDWTRLKELHKETETALQVVLATGAFEPGDYVANDYTRNWRPAEGER